MARTDTRTPLAAPTRARLAPWVAAVEVGLAAVAVLLDLLLPALVILALAAASLVARRERPASLGFHRLPRGARAALAVAGLTVLWTVLQVTLVTPVAEHLTGERRDVSDFAALEGDLALLLTLLALTWTLAALGEEVAFRGYLLTRLTEVVSGGRTTPDAVRPPTAGGAPAVATASAVPVLVASVASSALFGLIHTEQGLVGVVLTFVDALFYCALRLHFRSLWASVLAHGLLNTIGLTTYFLVGPFQTLW